MDRLRARLLQVRPDALTGFALYHEECDRENYSWMDVMVHSRLHCTWRARLPQMRLRWGIWKGDATPPNSER